MEISCTKYIEMISDEMDGELDKNRALFLMRHLVACGECRNEYERGLHLREFIIEGSSASGISVPQGFSGKIFDIIERDDLAQKALFEPSRVKVGRLFGRFFSKIQNITLPTNATLAWSFAVSLLLIFSVTILNDNSTLNGSLKPSLMDAKRLKPKIFKADHIKSSADKEDSINYYINRHTEAIYSRPLNSPIERRGAQIALVSYGGTVNGLR